MEVRYHVEGQERKSLVQAVERITGKEVKYQGAPTFAYEIGNCTITRDGTLETADGEGADQVLKGLAEAGFEGETFGETDETRVGLTISMPLDKVNVGNLTRLLDAKGNLIKKALRISALPIEVGEDTVSFPWFGEVPNPDSVKAYTHFISALCQMSREQKRITATAKDVENEKYAFRSFLLRLGFIGKEYKIDREILLQNLSGSSAFKGGVRNADAK